MADAVMTLLVESLCQLITEKVKLIGGAKDELDNLLQVINTLKAFLQDNDQQESNSNSWKTFVKNIRTQAHKADDVIDKFVLEAKLHEEKNIWKKTLSFGRHIKRVNNLAKGIKDICEKVKVIRQENPQVLQPRPMLNLPRRLAREPQTVIVMTCVGIGVTTKEAIVVMEEEEEEAVEVEEVTVIEEEEKKVVEE
uniref:NRC1 n=1 Tax=Solanum tuberosum TaxID=4113 RepID=M1ABV7_SOLTU